MIIPVKFDTSGGAPIPETLIDRAQDCLSSGDYFGYILKHNRCGRLGALLNIAYSVELSKSQLNELMFKVWQDSEETIIDRNEWRRLFGMLGQLMTDAQEPPPVTERTKIYRGFQAPMARPSIMGLSWTLDKDRAAWFANRWGLMPDCKRYLAETTITPHLIKGYIVGRGESEIVLLPTHARQNMTVQRIE